MLGRRKLLKLLAKAIISFAALFFLSSIYFLREGAPKGVISQAREPVFIANIRDLSKITSIKFAINGEPGILIYFEGSLQAFCATCPHMGCPVSGKSLESRGVIECPCHASVFDPLTGERISGPAPRGLRRIEIEIKDGSIYALPW